MRSRPPAGVQGAGRPRAGRWLGVGLPGVGRSRVSGAAVPVAGLTAETTLAGVWCPVRSACERDPGAGTDLPPRLPRSARLRVGKIQTEARRSPLTIETARPSAELGTGRGGSARRAVGARVELPRVGETEPALGAGRAVRVGWTAVGPSRRSERPRSPPRAGCGRGRRGTEPAGWAGGSGQRVGGRWAGRGAGSPGFGVYFSCLLGAAWSAESVRPGACVTPLVVTVSNRPVSARNIAPAASSAFSCFQIRDGRTAGAFLHRRWLRG